MEKLNNELERLEAIDIYDIDLLRRFNNLHHYAIAHLNKLIDLDTENYILVIQGFTEANVDHKLSKDNKLIELKKYNSSLVDEYLRTQAELKITKNQVDQIKEKINSIKKSIDVIPRG